MKNSLRSVSQLLFTLALCCAATTAFAQDREAHLISARAGGVNFVAGEVSLTRPGQAAHSRPSVKDDLQPGDVVRTGADGRIEVLLNPGSYFRLGENSEFELVSASLNDLRLKLNSGSAVVEATGYDGLDLSLTVNTPRSRINLVRSGIYRFNTLPSGMTEVVVQKGRALIGEDRAAVIKGGKVALAGAEGGGVEIAKLEKRERDALDLWSRERGKELAKANQRLSARSVNTLLANALTDSLYSTGFRDASSGVWFWNARGSCYTFLPFASQWRSPYGHWYEQQLGWGGFDSSCNCRPLSVHRVVNNGLMTVNSPDAASPQGNSTAGPAQPPATITGPTPIERGFPRKVDPGDMDGPSRGITRPRPRDQ